MDPIHPLSHRSVLQQEQIRREWEAAAPEWGRQDLWTYVQDAAQGVNDHLVELARLGPGDRVLDVGTGIGEPAATAARRVGPDGWVLGIDLAPSMIEEGRQRMVRLGLDRTVELRCGNAERLELEGIAFDAVLSRWALMLAADLRATLASYLQLLEPGGRLAVALWGHPERVPFIQLAMHCALQWFQGESAPEPGPQHFWDQGRETLNRLGREAGFEQVRTEAFEVVFEFPSAEVYADFISRMAGPIKMLTNQCPPEARQRLLDEIARRARPFSRPDGSVRLPNENLILHGVRPSA